MSRREAADGTTSDDGAPRARLPRCALFAAVAALSATACLPFALVPGLHWDDAYITLRFAAHLAAGHGLVFNPGEPSNGFTSALWTLVLAGVALVTGPRALPAAAEVLGVLCHAAAAGATAGLVQDRLGRPWIAALAGLAVGANPLLVLLAVSGMETPLALLLVASTLWLHGRHGLGRPVLLGAVLGLAILARPELALLAAAILAVELGRAAGAGRRRADLRALVLCSCAVLAVAGPWTAGNRLRSGDWFPGTWKGKLVGRLPERHGITYPELLALSAGGRARLAAVNLRDLFGPAEGGTLALPAVLGLAAVGILSAHPALRARLRPHGPTLLAAGSSTVLLLGFLAFFFPLPIPRYAAPLLPPATAAVFMGLGCLLQRATRRAERAVVLTAAGGAAGALLLAYRAFLPHAAAEQVRGEIGSWLAASVPGDAVVALEPIGQIGFTSGLRIVDLGGLASSEVWPYIVRGYRSDLAGLGDFLARRGVTHVVDYPGTSPFSLAPLTGGPEYALLRTFGSGRDRHLVFERLPAENARRGAVEEPEALAGAPYIRFPTGTPRMRPSPVSGSWPWGGSRSGGSGLGWGSPGGGSRPRLPSGWR